jgi:cytochrome oxidase assembly protein ShyY1
MQAAATLRRGVLIPSVAAFMAFAVLVSLGLWQLDRKAWKDGLIATLGQRLSALPVALPAASAWPQLTAAQDEFTRVTMTGEFLHDREAAVYTIGSSMREGPAGPGYWIFTPVRLSAESRWGGAVVMVNRGFVPDGRRDAATGRPARSQARSILSACCAGLSRPACSPRLPFRPGTRGSRAIPTPSPPPRASALHLSTWNWKVRNRPADCPTPDGCMRCCRTIISATP